MHASTTELSHTTLAHAKELIKELDEAQFSYDRAALLTLLASFTHAHKHADESSTVEHLQEILTRLEDIEQSYHERIYTRDHTDSMTNYKEVLGTFQSTTLAAPAWAGLFSWVAQYMRAILSWLEVSMLWIILLVAGSMLLLWGPHSIWYALIVLSFFGCAVLFLKWMCTLGWRIVVAALVGSMVVAWAMII
jgi:hypothetical protein